MNIKIKSFFTLMVISVFLLSSCEVYQTLYGTSPKETTVQVIRVEGDQAKDVVVLAKKVYASAQPTEHDPFKLGNNPLGPFEKGKSLGFTLEQWLAAKGVGVYSVDDENAELDISFKNLVPNGVYTVWCSKITLPPNFNIVDNPCGAEDGSESSFTADAKGSGSFSVKLKPLEQSTNETISVVALAYHSDGKTQGISPGDFGLNSHVQLAFMFPAPTQKPTKVFQIPMKFVNHIEAGFPEQDVFIEVEKVAAPEEEVMEKEVAEEEKEAMEEKPPVTGKVTKEEIMEEKPREKPVVIVVQETELVSLVPKAEDPDKDTALVFTFTSPLNENGEWQTTYGDAGEYTITVTASDSESTTTKDVLIIVNRKEEPPQIESTKPIESGLVIDETQEIDFSVVTSDLNKDTLSYRWKLDGIDVSSEKEYTYKTSYEDAGTHTVKADVSDGLSTSSKIWSVNVKNVNRKPLLEQIGDLKVEETDKITITVLATDEDKDAITYAVSNKQFVQEDNVFTWETNYDSAGTYEVTVSASDGQDTAEQKFEITVDNVNRPPVITDIVQKK